MSESVYIAGPMTGIGDYNYPAFKAAASRWRKLGWNVSNPCENFGGATDRGYHEYIRADLEMLMFASAIALLPGWGKSRGARFELLVAQLLQLPVYDAETLELFVPLEVITSVGDPPDLDNITPPPCTAGNLCTKCLAALSKTWPEFKAARFRNHPPLAKVETASGTESILDEAQRIVHSDRGASYGHPIEDYARTGKMWGAILGRDAIDPRICCLMMIAVKLSRETNKHSRDNLTDVAGYAECASMVADRQVIEK